MHILAFKYKCTALSFGSLSWWECNLWSFSQIVSCVARSYEHERFSPKCSVSSLKFSSHVFLVFYLHLGMLEWHHGNQMFSFHWFQRHLTWGLSYKIGFTVHVQHGLRCYLKFDNELLRNTNKANSAQTRIPTISTSINSQYIVIIYCIYSYIHLQINWYDGIHLSCCNQCSRRQSPQ